jgi:hypothetical protein
MAAKRKAREARLKAKREVIGEQLAEASAPAVKPSLAS